jgi:hypothetical protein
MRSTVSRSTATKARAGPVRAVQTKSAAPGQEWRSHFVGLRRYHTANVAVARPRAERQEELGHGHGQG